MAKKKVVRVKKLGPPPSGLPIADPVKFLTDTGILWHVNVTVFNPLGLGVAVDPSAPGGYVLTDYRNDPVQVLPPEDYVAGRAKFDRYLEEVGKATMRKRGDALGFVTQRTPDCT